MTLKQSKEMAQKFAWSRKGFLRSVSEIWILCFSQSFSFFPLADSLVHFHTWKEPERICKCCRILAARSGYCASRRASAFSRWEYTWRSHEADRPAPLFECHIRSAWQGPHRAAAQQSRKSGGDPQTGISRSGSGALPDSFRYPEISG